ncbi:Os02g0656550, partial [Oryza sativa Japonica Group]
MLGHAFIIDGLVIPGFITSPGLDLIRSCRPSRWVRTNWKPHRASVREIVCSVKRSSNFLLNFGWSLSCKTKTMSPVTTHSFISFTLEYNLLAMLHSLLNMNL